MNNGGNLNLASVWVIKVHLTGEFPAQKTSNAEMFPFDDVIMMLLVYRTATIYVKTGNLVNESHVIWVIFFIKDRFDELGLNGITAWICNQIYCLCGCNYLPMPSLQAKTAAEKYIAVSCVCKKWHCRHLNADYFNTVGHRMLVCLRYTNYYTSHSATSYD